MEKNVLQGAEETIKKYKPYILMERNNPMLVVNGTSSKEVLELLKNLNYKILNIEYLKINPLLREFSNVFCLPS